MKWAFSRNQLVYLDKFDWFVVTIDFQLENESVGFLICRLFVVINEFRSLDLWYRFLISQPKSKTKQNSKKNKRSQILVFELFYLQLWYFLKFDLVRRQFHRVYSSIVQWELVLANAFVVPFWNQVLRKVQKKT